MVTAHSLLRIRDILSSVRGTDTIQTGDRYGVTLPVPGIPPARQRDLIAAIADLGSTDLAGKGRGLPGGGHHDPVLMLIDPDDPTAALRHLALH
jgi:hypothetical protein